ncbi:MAG TPA: hypothetical protein VD815_04455 [Candidatus Saccharimonadales bacterium]|nr:hypothetical protein [Candidatus Saccharimonadales bacterium]
MNILFAGILTVFLVVTIVGAYTPNALATPSSQLETCGNNAMAQQGNSAAEQEKEQSQASDTNGQAVTPELNTLNANNLNLGLQQNGGCIPTVEQPPSDFTTSSQN